MVTFSAENEEVFILSWRFCSHSRRNNPRGVRKNDSVFPICQLKRSWLTFGTRWACTPGSVDGELRYLTRRINWAYLVLGIAD